MDVKAYKKGLESTYRLGALLVCCGFRTVSGDAAHVIASMVPLDLLAKERAITYTEKHSGSTTGHQQVAKAAREESLRKW